MNKAEMTKVLTFCSALDGQQVTEAKVLMWLQVLDGVSYEECQQGIVPAYSVAPNEIVTAKGLLDTVKSARPSTQPLMYKQDEAELDEAGWLSDPQPICEAHDLRILSCDDCCSLIHHEAGFMSDVARHSWAMTNVYKAKQLW